MTEIQLPENLQSSEKAGFHIMRDCMTTLFGPEYVEKVLRKAKGEFAKAGVLMWQPNDANIVIDISPMPEPWEGQWGYRLRFAAIQANGDTQVNQFYVPMSVIPTKKGN